MTIALTSAILAARHETGPENRTTEDGPSLFSRLIGAAGFQLINVNNVPLQLRSWSLDTRLLGRQALIASLSRHYRAQAISEAHKVVPRHPPALSVLSPFLYPRVRNFTNESDSIFVVM